MSKEFFEVLRLTSAFSVIIPLIFALLFFARLTKVQRKLTLLLLVVLIVEITTNVMWYHEMNNLLIYHVYTVVEFLLFLNIFKEVLSKLITLLGVVLLGTGFSLFSVIISLFYQRIYEFNSIAITVLSVSMILIALASFYSLLKEHSYSKVERNPIFWISAGILIYFSGNLILFYINNALNLTLEESYIIWGMHAVVNIVLILFYTRAIWVHPAKE